MSFHGRPSRTQLLAALLRCISRIPQWPWALRNPYGFHFCHSLVVSPSSQETRVSHHTHNERPKAPKRTMHCSPQFTNSYGGHTLKGQSCRLLLIFHPAGYRIARSYPKRAELQVFVHLTKSSSSANQNGERSIAQLRCYAESERNPPFPFQYRRRSA